MTTDKQDILTVIEELRDEFRWLSSELEYELNTIETAVDGTQDDVDEAIGETVEGCDTATGGKIQRMSHLCDTLAKQLNGYRVKQEEEAVA